MHFNEHQHSFCPERRVNRGLASLLSPVGHSRWCCHHRSPQFESTFLRSLRSTPITKLHHYYGRSDSCRLQALRDLVHELRLFQPSGLPDSGTVAFSTIPSPTTKATAVVAFARYPSAQQLSVSGLGSRHWLAGSAQSHPAGESSFLTYGLVVHFLLLSTSPRGDAVAVGYRPESAYLKRTFTSPTTRAFRRTSPWRKPWDQQSNHNQARQGRNTSLSPHLCRRSAADLSIGTLYPRLTSWATDLPPLHG